MTRTPVAGQRNNRGAAKAAPLRSMPVRLLRTGVLLSVVLSTGCYSYSLIDPAQANPGLAVRARITPVESARLEELTGLRDRVVHGEIVHAEADAIVLSVPALLAEPGLPSSMLHQRITLPSSAIVELEQRQLSRWRTFSLVGAVAVLAGYVVVTQFGDDDAEPGPDKPRPDALVLYLRAR